VGQAAAREGNQARPGPRACGLPPHRPLRSWRLFGDLSQERQVSVRALGWLSQGVLVAASGPDPAAPAGSGGGAGGGGAGPAGYELLLLPRYHLDLTSLLARCG
jgi:hypothetical protein